MIRYTITLKDFNTGVRVIYKYFLKSIDYISIYSVASASNIAIAITLCVLHYTAIGSTGGSSVAYLEAFYYMPWWLVVVSFAVAGWILPHQNRFPYWLHIVASMPGLYYGIFLTLVTLQGKFLGTELLTGVLGATVSLLTIKSIRIQQILLESRKILDIAKENIRKINGEISEIQSAKSKQSVER